MTTKIGRNLTARAQGARFPLVIRKNTNWYVNVMMPLGKEWVAHNPYPKIIHPNLSTTKLVDNAQWVWIIHRVSRR